MRGPLWEGVSWKSKAPGGLVPVPPGGRPAPRGQGLPGAAGWVGRPARWQRLEQGAAGQLGGVGRMARGGGGQGAVARPRIMNGFGFQHTIAHKKGHILCKCMKTLHVPR